MLRYVRNPFTNSRVINNKFYISNYKQGYELNEVSKEIWVLLKKPISVEDITTEICNYFDGDEKEISADIRSFIDDLVKRELIERA
jgi:DNA-directed RNA polymerase delta subunit